MRATRSSADTPVFGPTRSRQYVNPRSFLVKLGFIVPAMMLTACQALQTPVAPPNSHLNINPTANQSAPPQSSDSSANGQNTYTVKRDSLKQSLSLQGRVAPTRSAQLTLHGGGTVTAVNVQAGQAVKQGDTLAQFAADDQTLQAARTQSTLAELAFEQEQSKLTELQNGTPKDTVDQAQAVVARDKAAIAQLNQQTQAAQDASQKAVQSAQKSADTAQKTAASAKTAADRKVQLAQVAQQSAQDALTAAQDAAKQAEDATKTAQTKEQADAAAAVLSAKQAVVVADRALKVANLKLGQAKMNWASTRASQDLETLQFKMQQDQDALKDAQAADKAAQTGPAAQAAAADAALAGAKRTIAADQLQLKHTQLSLDTSKIVDDAAVQEATFAAQAAQDGLTQAQDAQAKAEQKVKDLAQQQPVGQTGPGATQLTPAAAQAGIKQAQHALDTATIDLQDAQAAAQAAADQLATAGSDVASAGDASAANTPAAPDQSSMDAARAQLAADQAKLTSLQAGTSQVDIRNQQARVNLTHDQATAAAAAAQPVMTLTAPFDGTVTDVGINAGQTIAPGSASDSGMTTAGAALAGQNNGQPVAIRIVASGTTSIVADASETDVAQLSPGQAVDINFPGLPGQNASASISQIASAPSVKQDGSVSYPVQIDLPSAPSNLKIGMTAQVNLSSGNDQTLVAPRVAVQTVGGQSTVTKVDPSGQFESVPVQLGKSSGGNVELLSGIQEGDKILLPATPALPPLVANAQPPATGNAQP